MKHIISQLLQGKFPHLLEDWSVPKELTSEGACVTEDPKIFDGETFADIQVAKRICRGCTVQQLCLEYALQTEEYGIWGGATPEERRALLGTGPIVTPEDRSLVNQLQLELKSNIPIQILSEKYGVSERTCLRWKAKLAS